ncbi:MAG: primosomal protein N' [Proteobacteria bacterium]|nr:primosomal protein N' [Pseudomonadota bacterium]
MQTLFQETESPAPAAGAKVSVLVPYPVDRAYSYAVPEGLGIAPGDYVIAPLGSRDVPGVVWDDAPESVATKKIKSVVAKCDMPPMPSVHRRFLDWVAQYNMTPLGSVLKMSLSVPAALDPPKAAKGYRISKVAQEVLFPVGGGRGEGFEKKKKFLQNLSPQRQKILEILSDGMPRRASEIAEAAGCTPAVVKGLLKYNLIEEVDLHTAAPCRKPDISKHGPSLSEVQGRAARKITDYIRSGGYHAALLDGVTGAGKTEVYFEGVAEAVKAGRQVLILLPEIALSNAFLERFKNRFGCAPALWHSALSPNQRRNAWRGVAAGETKVVVGARSALFLPFADLGLIIVDEEHDPAYKQEDGVIYNARDMAVVRAHLGKIPIVLVSATPSLETMANIWAGRYEHLQLPDRHGAARLPDMHVIDMKKDKPERQHFIAPPLKEAIAANLAAGEQSLLFLNRRGYAPLTICRACGHRIECPRCTAWLVEHKKSSRLHCHHCGFSQAFPKACPSCGDQDSLAACGPGVERILEEVKEYFPQARIVVLASDTAGSQEDLRKVLNDIREHKYDIIIGTQIIAKGHHFPRLTLVGVIDADLGLGGGDLRAAERTFQLLHQVAGRAGREELPGHVYLQTFVPGNKVMQALAGHDRDAFLEIEAAERQAAQMPPFSRLAGIVVSGKDERAVMDIAAALGKCAPQGEGLLTLGPAEAPFYRLRGNYRRRLLVRADKKIDLQKVIDGWLAQIKIPSAIRIYTDIDPQSFL